MTSRLLSGGVGAAALAAALIGLPAGPAAALPLPVTTAQAVAGDAPLIDVGYRRHYRSYAPRAYGYRHARYYRRDRSGAVIAGAALGLVGALAATSVANAYYDRPYYGSYGYYPASYGYYPASYGYAPAYSYGYAYPAYSYGYAYPSYGYGYRRAYYGGGWGGHRAYRGGGWGGGRSAIYGGHRWGGGGWKAGGGGPAVVTGRWYGR